MIRTIALATALAVTSTFALSGISPASAGGYGYGTSHYTNVDLCKFVKWDPHSYSWVTFYAPCSQY